MANKRRISADEAKRVGATPPVQYGVVPAGARQSSLDVTPLQAGQSYDVNLLYWTGPGAQDGTFIGSRDFTP